MSRARHIGFLPAAEKILSEAGKPLHYLEVTKRALEQGWVVSQSKNPASSMYAQIWASIRRDGEASPFVRPSRGFFGLRSWISKEDAEASDDLSPNSTGVTLFGHFPVYSSTRALLPVWAGATRRGIVDMKAAIGALRGTRQEPVDWSDPDTWIEEKISGEPRLLARRIWEDTRKQVNPRYISNHWRFAIHHRFLEQDEVGGLHLTERGREFVEEPAGAVIRQIDEDQGVFKILALVAELGPAKRSDLLDSWLDFLRGESDIRSESAVKSMLSARLRNLNQRDLVNRTGYSYVITQGGLDYLEMVDKAAGRDAEPDPDQHLRELLRKQKQRIRESIRDLLADIDPFAFEHVIRQLLEEMGYDDVEVTSATRDKGVDVIGRIELGITSVREVIQVKRVRGNIARPVLDALRGSLHRFEAVRGTIITTGGFSKGTREAAFEAGAAPITLIDGEKLLDLLIEHGIGVRVRKAELWELDPESFLGEQEEVDGPDE